MDIATNKKREVSFERACSLLCEFIRKTDVDTLAAMFSDTFGYDVGIDIERELFICIPNDMCGNILDASEFIKG